MYTIYQSYCIILRHMFMFELVRWLATTHVYDYRKQCDNHCVQTL